MNTTVSTVICGAPWGCTTSCPNHGEKARRVDGIVVCHNCYCYVWKMCRRDNKQGVMSFSGLEGPSRARKRVTCTCSREGCGRQLGPGMGQKFRFILDFPLCDSCYQAIYRRARRRNISLYAAWSEIPVKNNKLSRAIRTAAKKNGKSKVAA